MIESLQNEIWKYTRNIPMWHRSRFCVYYTIYPLPQLKLKFCEGKTQLFIE